MTPQQQAEKVAREIAENCCGDLFSYQRAALGASITDALLTFESERLKAAKSTLSMMERWMELNNSDDSEVEELTLQTVMEHVRYTLELLNGGKETE